MTACKPESSSSVSQESPRFLCYHTAARAFRALEIAEEDYARMTEVHKQDGNVILPSWQYPRREGPNSMIQGKKITITGGKLTNVGGDYHEHNTYVIEESATRPKYLKRILGQY